ncbi:MAG TPA: ABC transporter ATP-binding protein [Streptosporangiaceae bacterium]|jgi:peptide/nickel transport system ATP-binding protein
MSEPLLEVRELRKVFVSGWMRSRRTVRAVQEVSFALAAGEAVGLVGESGSGKSTVARLIARLERPTAGQILLNGRDVVAAEPRRASRDYRHQVQMIFQDPFSSLNPVHTIGYHLSRSVQIHGTAGGRPISEAVAALLADVGLDHIGGIEARYPHELSGGQRQRAAIARTLAARPGLVVADEPTSMLDVSVRVGILNLLGDLRRDRGIGMLLITHDLASARYSTDSVMVMYAGRILESGPSGDLITSPQHPYTRLLVSSVPRRSGARPAEAVRQAGQGAAQAGCPFTARCPSRMTVCETTMPGVTQLAPGRFVRCHLHGPGGPVQGPGGAASQEAS